VRKREDFEKEQEKNGVERKGECTDKE